MEQTTLMDGWILENHYTESDLIWFNDSGENHCLTVIFGGFWNWDFYTVHQAVHYA